MFYAGDIFRYKDEMSLYIMVEWYDVVCKAAPAATHQFALHVLSTDDITLISEMFRNEL